MTGNADKSSATGGLPLLLTPGECARQLGISRSVFYELRARLIANGLRCVTVGTRRKYTRKSLEALVERAAEHEEAVA